MKHSEFKIGESFWCGGREWRCTDIGTRIVVAICLDDRTAVHFNPGPPPQRGLVKMNREQAEKEGWFNGPPYSVGERVFDEYEMPACAFDKEGTGEGGGFEDESTEDGLRRPQFDAFLAARRKLLHASMELGDTVRETHDACIPIRPPVYLIHGKGGSPEGSVRKLQELFQKRRSTFEYMRPAMPHGDPNAPAEESVRFLQSLNIPLGSIIVGVSLGGLVAAKLQELGREDLFVFAISSPTWVDGVSLDRCCKRRVAVYSSTDEVIEGRVSRWPELSSLAFDFDWLTHDTDRHIGWLTNLWSAYCKQLYA